jgi:DNA-binding MarR family transcriptional regulator
MAEFRKQRSHSQLDDVLTAVFRLNGSLLSARDRLVKDLGLTNTLWQVLDEVSLEASPLSVAQIARRIGLTRQAVQRTTNDLVASGMATVSASPVDRRTHLIALTVKGAGALAAANERHREWLATFSSALGGDSLDKAADFMRTANMIVGALPNRQEMVRANTIHTKSILETYDVRRQA